MLGAYNGVILQPMFPNRPTELKNAKGYVTAQRMGTWAQARAGLKWLRFGGKLIFGI